MTPQEKFERYANLFNLVHSAKARRTCDHPAEQQRWKDKLNNRMRWVKAFSKSQS